MLNFSHIWKKLLNTSDYSSKSCQTTPIAYSLDIGSLSDKGCSRTINQDYIGLVSSPDGNDFLVVLADGMGGHQAGDIASRIAVEEVQHNYFSQLKKRSPEQALNWSFQKANTAVFTRAQQSPEYQGMGTTLVALSLHESAAYFAFTGDSRLYLIQDDAIHQLSHDHTLVAEMLKQGLITAEQAKDHPEKHLITHAIGTQKKAFVDISKTPLVFQPGDCFLLCSDGLYDLVEDIEILEWSTTYSAQQACQGLVDLANSRGGYDNISVVVIKIQKGVSILNETPITRS